MLFGDPKKTWMDRKNDNSFGLGPYEAPTLDECNENRISTTEFIKSIEADILNQKLNRIVGLAKEFSSLNEEQIVRIIEASIGANKL